MDLSEEKIISPKDKMLENLSRDIDYLLLSASNVNSEIDLSKSDIPQRTISAKVVLQNKEMWTKFYAVGTEMVITKSGR